LTELEAELRDVKDRLTSEFENVARVVDTLNTENLKEIPTSTREIR
jgi:hypothetical protein